jgi:glycosyltransferase involved in cell wall biosynthesis
MNPKIPLMLCTHARGGMRSVVEAYERDAIFAGWGFQSIWTHREGSAFTRVWTALMAYCRMLVLLAGGKVSFMHVHAAMRGSFWRKALFIATARRFGVPSIIHLHGSQMEMFYQALSHARKNTVRRTLEKADAVVVLSDAGQRFVQEVAPNARITVVKNYVVLPPWAGGSAPGPAPQLTILFLGAVGQRKGIYDLLACWPAVIAHFPQARLLVGGDGETALAAAKTRQLGIDSSVELLGWVGGERKRELLEHADVFVLPSYNEGLPMSVLEAMSYGKPVITTRVGGIPELITHDEDGILVDAGDHAQLTAALLRLGRDQPFRRVLGSAARRRIEAGFSDHAVLPLLENVYRQVASTRERV